MSQIRRPASFAYRNRHRLTFAVFALGGIASVMWLVILTGRINRVEATRVATIQANYTACVRSVPILRQLNAAFRGAETVADVLLINAKATHAVTDPETPMYRQQTKNIARLREAIMAGKGVLLPVPTRKECEERRDKALAGG